jgi:non-homologous end joining protein Ku
MRFTWSGALIFGRGAIPVTMHSAVRSKERISFGVLREDDLSAIEFDDPCESKRASVPWNAIVNGYECANGEGVRRAERGLPARERSAPRKTKST